MGSCCTKAKKEEDHIPFKLFPPLENKECFTEEPKSKEYESLKSASPQPIIYENPFKEDETLLKCNKKGNFISTAADFNVGKYFDKQIDIWYKSIYVMETDSLRKQFLSLYKINMKNLDKEQFEAWCEKNGYFQTKKYFEAFQRLDYFPLNRTLMALSHKHEVKMHLSDLFMFKGRGPYRAVTCYGRQSSLVDRALNEYEVRLGRNVAVPYLVNNWDNCSFPEPTIDIKDHHLDIRFHSVRRNKPIVPFTPHWPYEVNKDCPIALRLKFGDKFLDTKDSGVVVDDKTVSVKQVTVNPHEGTNHWDSTFSGDSRRIHSEKKP